MRLLLLFGVIKFDIEGVILWGYKEKNMYLLVFKIFIVICYL